MASPSENSRNRKGELPAAKAHERFLDRHRPVLLRYLDGTSPASAAEPDALGYVERVLTEWHECFGRSALPAPDATEKTFWCALYQLEELAELGGPHTDPYEKILLQVLAELRELLRHRRPLPEDRFIVTRPDGTP